MAALAGCAATHVTSDPVYFPSPPGPPRVVHLKSFNSLKDVVPVRANWRDFFRGGPVSPYVSTPAGIAFRDGHLYICDTGINAVHDWDLAAGEARRIGTKGDVILAKPVAVAVDSAGTVYVADTERAEVVAYGRDGQPLGRFKPPDREHYRPVAVAVDNTKLYVADIVAHVVDVFSTNDGTHVGTVGQLGSSPGRFYFPMGLATNADGELFVSDMMNGRVQVFDAQHRHQLSIGQPGNRYGDLGKPRHVAIGPDGVVFIADSGFAHVHLFDRQGRLLMLIGGPGEDPGTTPLPTGVAVAERVPDRIAALVPADFAARYYLFVTNTIGPKRINLFAVGSAR